MNWTKEKPTQEGFYWLRENGETAVVRISIESMGTYVLWSGDDQDSQLASRRFDSAEWFGPLEPPT